MPPYFPTDLLALPSCPRPSYEHSSSCISSSYSGKRARGRRYLSRTMIYNQRCSSCKQRDHSTRREDSSSLSVSFQPVSFPEISHLFVQRFAFNLTELNGRKLILLMNRSNKKFNSIEEYSIYFLNCILVVLLLFVLFKLLS